MRKLRRDRGISLINLILLILVTILVVFLAYEVFYIDILDIMEPNEEYASTLFSNTTNRVRDNDIQNKEVVKQNVEVVLPSIDEIIDKNIDVPSDDNNNTFHTKHYYYKQLDDIGKRIYKGIEDNIDYMKSGNYKIDFKTEFNRLLHEPDGEEKLNTAFQSAWDAITYDYMDLFYIDVTKIVMTTKTTTVVTFETHRVHLSAGGNENYFTKGITSATDLKVKEAYIKNVRDKIVKDVQGKTEYEQIQYVHDWLVDNLKYDRTYEKEDVHNIYGALINKEVVCEGYARAFKYILDELKIENVLVSGDAKDREGKTEGHAWNYVKLDGKWYAIDVTWDDPIIEGGGKLTKKLKYQYFLKGSDTFFKDHTEDGYLSKESMKFEFPTLEKKDYK